MKLSGEKHLDRAKDARARTAITGRHAIKEGCLDKTLSVYPNNLVQIIALAGRWRPAKAMIFYSRPAHFIEMQTHTPATLLQTLIR